MAQQGMVPWRWSGLRGYSTRSAPQSLPEDLGTRAYNVALSAGTLGRRRLSLTSVDLTGGPTAIIHYLAAWRPTLLTHRLFAFSSLTLPLKVHSWDGSTWTAHPLSDLADTPAVPCALTFNDKLFIAYDSVVNRLHVYDGTSIRRVGLGQDGVAPTVANTGAGAYPATARFYRTQWLIKNGSDVQAMWAAIRSSPQPSSTTPPIPQATAAPILPSRGRTSRHPA
jgi:hypothetical protein